MSLNAFDILYFWYYFHKIRNRIWSRFQRLHAVIAEFQTVFEISPVLGRRLFYSLLAHLIVGIYEVVIMTWIWGQNNFTFITRE